MDSDLIGIKVVLLALVFLACTVGAFFIGPVVGVIVSICAVSLVLYLGIRYFGGSETDV